VWSTTPHPHYQIESRIEAKFKRIPDAERRINACAQKRAMDSNLDVVGNVRKVNGASALGPYKYKKS